MILIIIQVGIINIGKQINIEAKIDDITNTYDKNTNRIYSKAESCNSINNKLFQNEIQRNLWKLEIPKINLNAEIAEGTNQEILNKFIGHFEETPKEFGNIGLAAHNRGYEVNYFERIKELEKGDEIYYTYNGNTKCYIVNLYTIIKDTNWNYLENTKENKITLITCLENRPEYRRCIQAIEK